MRIFVSGMIAADPGQGGAAWAVLQYVLGFRELGHEVFLVEPIARDPFSRRVRRSPHRSTPDISGCGRTLRLRARRGAAKAGHAGNHRRVIRRAATSRRGRRPADQHLWHAARSGAARRIPRRVYLDLDPAFNQLWHAAEGIDVGSTVIRITSPSAAASVGPTATSRRAAARGSDAAADRAGGVAGSSRRSRRRGPPLATGAATGRSTTRAGISARRPIRSGDSSRCRAGRASRFLLALAIHPAETDDLAALRANRWGLVDPAAVAATPDDYRAFVHASKGEFGIAKSGYVVSHSGWFSDRSVCYLASGRPVLAQDTGLPRSSRSDTGS